MKKNPFVIIIIFVLFVFTLNAENRDNLEKKKVDLKVIESSFSQRFEEIKEAIKKGDFENGKLDQYYVIFKGFSENEYIEKATNIRREYFVKTTEYLRKMNAMKKEIHRAEEIKDFNDPRYIAAKKYYKPVFTEFAKYFQDPPEIKVQK